jgi:hypothetical protein
MAPPGFFVSNSFHNNLLLRCYFILGLIPMLTPQNVGFSAMQAVGLSERRSAAGSLIAGLLVGMLSTTAQAYEVFGDCSSVSCSQWLEDRQSASSEHYADENWVLGFLTGVNAATSSTTGSGSDAEGKFAWIDNYCRAHPLELLVGAAERLWYALNQPASK